MQQQVDAVYLDTETTGLDPAHHSVIEVGAVLLGPSGVELASYQSLANPGEWAMKNSEPRAFEVSGIDPADVRAARPIEEVAREFREWLSAHAGTIYAYPLAFDQKFLLVPPWSVQAPTWGKCVMLAAQDIMGKAGVLPLKYGRPKFPKLSEAAAFFHVSSPRFHRALDDARTAGKIHRAIVDLTVEEAASYEAENLMEGGM